MTATWLRRTQQVILLCFLALCVAIMHHAGATSGMPDATEAAAVHVMSADEPAPGMTVPATESGGHHPGMPGGAHDMLHLCLAVLGAVGALLLAWLLFLRPAGSTAALTRPICPRGLRAPGRPPPQHGRTLLTSLCVLRL